MRRRCFHLCLLLSLLFALPSCPATAVVPIATFTTSGSRILKNGADFVVHGINVDGPGWQWNRKTVDDIDAIAGAWKFNLIRVNCCLKPHSVAKEPNDLDAIVQAFTARGVVVLIDPHDHVGGYYEDPPKPADTPSLTDLQNWIKPLAVRYKDNPFVWFEVMASPGSPDEKTVSGQWMDVHQRTIQTIRRDAGASNIIVCDGVARGSEDGASGTLAVPDDRSAILTYGQELAKQVPNLVFGFRMSTGWNAGVPKLTDYVDRVQAKHLPLLVTEYGLWMDGDATAATEAMLSVCKARHIGRCAWHWFPGDRNPLAATDNQYGGWQIDTKDGTHPSNLSWLGDKVWDDNHDITPFHGPALDRTGWTATAFLTVKDSKGIYNQPDEAFSAYPNESDYWSSGTDQKPGQWFQVDMGARRTFTRLSIDPRARDMDYLRAYAIYVSNDGVNWGTPIARGKNGQSILRVSFAQQTARYIKVVLEDAKSWRYWVIADFEVYAPVGALNAASAASEGTLKETPIEPRGWSATSEPRSWQSPALVFRPLPPDNSGWCTDKEMAPGQYVQIDMAERQRFNRIVLSAGRRATDYLRGYEIYVSDDGVSWGKPIKSGRGAPITTITFPTQNARFIRVVQTRYGRWTQWCLAEFKVYAPAGAGAVAHLSPFDATAVQKRP